jgi:hypothetical protein
MQRPDLLERTVIATTAPERALRNPDAAQAFAVIAKPFNIDELVRVVGDCARRATGEARAEDSQADPPPPVDLTELQRFVDNVPRLRHVLVGAGGCQRELLLRSEMRRAVRELSAAFAEAAKVETSGTRAAAFLAASMVADQLSLSAAATRRVSRNDH